MWTFEKIRNFLSNRRREIPADESWTNKPYLTLSVEEVGDREVVALRFGRPLTPRIVFDPRAIPLLKSEIAKIEEQLELKQSKENL